LPDKPVVLDASIALAIILDEPAAAEVEILIRGWIGDARPMLVPGHFWLEVINTMGRAAGMPGESVLEGVHRIDGFDLETVETDRPLLLHAIDRMERFRLTAYDATYLALAERRDADLATFDRELAAAAGSRAIVPGQGRGVRERPLPYERGVTWPDYRGASTFLGNLRAEALARRA
jgi:predicted nucleic acid-binding protein